MNLRDYKEGGHELYAEFAEAIAGILRAAITQQGGLRLQNVQHRAKEVDKLRVKLVRARAESSDAIGDIAKDIAGCRVIFYTNRDVHVFGQSGILRENFDIDFERTKIHYPENKDDGAEFFISENWVVQLTEARRALPEYRRFAGLRCEVQVQTVLDHAWAEMAHDTIYKPMADQGFGAGAIEGIRKRLRKIMRDYLQPAGYEFDKIASNYAQLRDGKSMFDEDALAIIRACTDRNCLSEAIERFSNFVLPNLDDFQAFAPDIIDTLSEAAVRAVAMPDVPHATHFGEYPGTKVEAVIAKVCRVLESGYLLYVDPNRMFDAILAMRAAAQSQDQQKPIDDLARRFSQHDRRAWEQAGPGLQRMIVDRVATLDDVALANTAPVVTRMLRECLLSTVSGTTHQADAVILHSGAVRVSDAFKAMRMDALRQLERLHGLLSEGEIQASVRHAMTAAGDTPNNVGYSDELGVVIIDNLTEVVRFFGRIAASLELEAKRQLEVELFRIFYRYHALPAAMAENAALVEVQGRLLEAISDCRTVIDADADLARYRLLVGYDSVSRRMWDEASYDREGDSTDRSAAIDELVATVSDETADQWLSDLGRYVQTRSADGATFKGLQEFVKKVAARTPAVLLGWLPRLSDCLADWLPGMLHGLVEASRGAVVDTILEEWVAGGKYLSSIAHYLQWAEQFRFDLLVRIMEHALTTGDGNVLRNVALAAARQSERRNEPMFDEVYLPAARALAGRQNFAWTGGWFNWKNLGLLKNLNAQQTSDLLELLIDIPRLGMDGEQMLAIIAERHPDAVLGLIGKRFSRDRDAGDFHFEDLPYGLHDLRAPLAAVPEKVVRAARTWFEADPAFAQYRGGRLIAELFPHLELPIYPLLNGEIETGREGIEFVLSVLRAYEGQAFLHPLLREIVDLLDPEDELLGIVRIVIDSTGVMVGEYGSVEAIDKRKALVADWATDKRALVRDFAADFVKSAENTLAWERRRADESVALRKIEWED
jgi:ppGpp synthetase/RelA/SpoT-type nucleotidyltranferase